MRPISFSRVSRFKEITQSPLKEQTFARKKEPAKEKENLPADHRVKIDTNE